MNLGVFLAYPERAYWFVLLLVTSSLIIYNFYDRKKILQSLGFILKSASFPLPKNRIFKNSCYLIAFALSIVAYLGPQWGQKETSFKASGVDICFAVDLSKSMLADDADPSRLEQAKNQLSIFLPRLGAGDQSAIVAFSGSSYIVSPLTIDHAASIDLLSPLQPDFISDQSTNLSRGVGTCLEALNLSEVKEATELLESAAKVIVLISDGENTVKDPDNTLGKAEKLGVPVYTIAVGTLKGSTIPIVNDNNRRILLRDKRSKELVVSRLKDKALKEISSKTGGKIFYASNGLSAWKDFQETIASYKKESRDAGTKLNLEHRFQIFLLIAVLLLLIELFIPETVKKKKGALSS